MNGIAEALVIGALFGSYGLRVEHDPIEHPPKGALRYRGYDRGGTLIIKGWLVIDLYGSSEIVGEWCFDRVGDPENTGPQVGRGSLYGHLDGAELSVSLNPGFIEFNVSLRGVYDGRSFRGVWRYATVKRIVNEGAFEATRQDEAPDPILEAPAVSPCLGGCALPASKNRLHLSLLSALIVPNTPTFPFN